MKNYMNELLPDYPGDAAAKSDLKMALQRHFGCSHTVEVANGTVAIEIVLKALEIPRGASVIIPDLSFIATATAVANCGLIPVSADISDTYFGLTLESVKESWDESVAAVIVVHLSGIVNREIEHIADFCRKKGVFLIEDCAQAFPCSLDGKKVGTFGTAGTYSFQTSKIVAAGEGGCIATNSESLAVNCLSVANWGYTGASQTFAFPCGNYRLSAVQSYLLLRQLGKLPAILEQRFARAKELVDTFRAHGIEPCMPLPDSRFFDCPFFVPIKSEKKLNRIEPRAEYPMRNSKMVRTILAKHFPDLLEPYLAKNSSKQETVCERVIQSVDFVNIFNYNGIPADQIVKPYLVCA